MADPNVTNGQPTSDSLAGTTGNGPGAIGGGSDAGAQTTLSGPGAQGEESFFDPRDIADKPELMAAYKQMQKQFTKRMQEAAKYKDYAQYEQYLPAIQAYAQNPRAVAYQLAQQHGLLPTGIPQQGANGEAFNPQSWDDVMAEAKRQVMDEMKPVYGELRNLKKQSVETYLDREYPDWRSYEDDMVKTLQSHPSLANDPDKLYRLAVPDEVWQARATKAAMQKLRASTDGASVSGASATARETATTPSGPLSFDQAIAAARQKLASMGIRRPST